MKWDNWKTDKWLAGNFAKQKPFKGAVARDGFLAVQSYVQCNKKGFFWYDII